MIGRRETLLESLKQDITAKYPAAKIHTIAMSVTDLEKVKDLPSTLPEEYQDVEVLVNNAGLALGVASVDENDMKDAETVLNTNVLSIIALCRALVPGMKQRGSGHIINIGSIAGHVTYSQGFNSLLLTPALLHLITYSSIKVLHTMQVSTPWLALLTLLDTT